MADLRSYQSLMNSMRDAERDRIVMAAHREGMLRGLMVGGILVFAQTIAFTIILIRFGVF